MGAVLVTGFQPFGGEAMNPAWEAVRALPGAIGGAEVVKAEVPVAFGRGFAEVEHAMRECSPDLVLCIGQAGGRAKLTPEYVGINCMDARVPDNDGNQPLAQRIEEDGPDAYFSTLPVRAMAKAMNDAGIPAEVSFTAGTYVCNDMLYRLMHAIATDHPGVRGGFMHVPYATQQATRLPSATPSMSLETMTAGIALTVGAALATERDVSVSAGTTH